MPILTPDAAFSLMLNCFQDNLDALDVLDKISFIADVQVALDASDGFMEWFVSEYDTGVYVNGSGGITYDSAFKCEFRKRWAEQ